MDLSRLRAICNDYQECHLLKLTEWRSTDEIQPDEHSGPYAVLQEGYDPADLRMTPDEFLLGKAGEWISTTILFRMPLEVQCEQFIFGTAAEVVELLTNLPEEARIFRNEELSSTPPPEGDQENERRQAFRQARLNSFPVRNLFSL